MMKILAQQEKYFINHWNYPSVFFQVKINLR